MGSINLILMLLPLLPVIALALLLFLPIKNYRAKQVLWLGFFVLLITLMTILMSSYNMSQLFLKAGNHCLTPVVGYVMLAGIVSVIFIALLIAVKLLMLRRRPVNF